MTSIAALSNSTIEKVAAPVEIEQPIFCGFALEYYYPNSAWELVVFGDIKGHISSVPRHFYGHHLDPNLKEVFEVRRNGNVLGYTATLVEAVGYLLGFLFNLESRIEPVDPKLLEKVPDYI
jgi:hypothetical protein